MKMNKIYRREELEAYLCEYDYFADYWRGDQDAYYNFKTRKWLLVPFDKEVFSEADIIAIFEEDAGATELGARMEYARFEAFVDHLRGVA